jgi:ParB/RepB/Spo0J family partition protein
MSAQSPTVVDLPCVRVIPGQNDRTVFDRDALQELAGSILEEGLIQPITVRPIGICQSCGHRVPQVGAPLNGNSCPSCGEPPVWRERYEIVAGERRFRAVNELLEWETIQGMVREMTDEQADGVMLAENLSRKDLLPIEEGNAYSKRMEAHGWSVAETARRANVSDGRVRSRLKLLKLDPTIQQLINQGDLPIGFGETMSALKVSYQRQVMAWLQKQSRRPTQSVFSAYVNQMLEEQASQTIFDLNTLIAPGVLEAIRDSEDGRLWEALPMINELPDLPVKLGGMATILDKYVVALLDADQQAAAAVVIDLWAKLQRANYATMPPLESATLERLVSQ